MGILASSIVILARVIQFLAKPLAENFDLFVGIFAVTNVMDKSYAQKICHAKPQFLQHVHVDIVKLSNLAELQNR